MAVTFFPSNPSQSAAVQAQFGANAAVDVAKLRAQEARALAQMQMQQAEREGFWRQQQQQQVNDLNRQQLAQNDFFNRGRLTNQAQANVANTAAAEAERFWQSNENDKNRANQLAISSAPRPQDAWRAQDLNTQVGQLADAANNYAEILNQKDALDAAALQIGKTSIMEDKRTFWNAAPSNPVFHPIKAGGEIWDYWLRDDAKRKSNVLSNLPKQIGSAPITPDMAMSPTENIGMAKAQLEAQNAALSKIIAAGSANGLDSHVTKGADGKWVATLKGAPPSATPFFNAPAPAITNAPVVPVAQPMTNTPAFNSGGIMPPAPPVGAIVRQNGMAYRFDGANYVPVQ